MNKIFIIPLTLLFLNSCAHHRMHEEVRYGKDVLEYHIVATAETARVRKKGGGAYSGSLKTMGPKRRNQLFINMAKRKMKTYCKNKNKVPKPNKKKSWSGNKKFSPQILEWSFQCVNDDKLKKFKTN